MKRKNGKAAREKRKYDLAKKTDELVKSWNPLPERGKTLPRLNSTIEKKSNFINCKQGYFNVGKFKGIEVKNAPIWYLNWVVNNIKLNQSELNLINKIIK